MPFPAKHAGSLEALRVTRPEGVGLALTKWPDLGVHRDSMAGLALMPLEELPSPVRCRGVPRLVDLEREAVSLLLAHSRQKLTEIVAESGIAREQDRRLAGRRHREDMRVIGATMRSRGNMLLLRLHQFRVNAYGQTALAEIDEQCLDCRALVQLDGVRWAVGVDDNAVASGDPVPQLMSGRSFFGLADVAKRAGIEQGSYTHGSRISGRQAQESGRLL